MINMKQGTLKFLLNVAIYTLPTTTNLNIEKNSAQIFTNCESGATNYKPCNQWFVKFARFTWRHTCVVNHIVNHVDKKKVHSVQWPARPHGPRRWLCETPKKPYIVILDNHEKTIHQFELACPSEKYIEFYTQHTLQVHQARRHLVAACNARPSESCNRTRRQPVTV